MLTTLADMVVQLACSWLVQSSLVLLPASAALVALRRLGPNFEALACRWILVGSMLTPIATLGMQAVGMRGWSVISQPAEPSATISQFAPSLNSPPTSESSALPATTINESDSDAIELRTIQAPPENAWLGLLALARWLLSFAWFTVSAILVVRLLRACNFIYCIRRSAVLDDDLQAHCQRLADSLKVRCPAVLRTNRVDGPCLVGVFRPAILLPDEAVESNVVWQQTLIHELAHVQRQDVLWNGLFRLSIALVPFQPMLWWLQRRHETAAEQASDDLVVQHVDEPASYAQMLLQLATHQHSQLPVAVGMIARKSILSQRIRRIMDERCRHGLTTSLRVKLSVMLIVLLQSVGVSWLWLPAATGQAATLQASETQKENNQQSKASLVKLTGRVLSVDKVPAAAALVNLRLPFKHWEQTLTADAQGRFEIELNIKPSQLPALRIKAASPDGSQMLLASVTDRILEGSSANVELQMQGTRTLQLRVVSSDDQPLADAKVLLLVLPGRNTLLQTTGADGRATLKIPSQQVVDTVVAWKDGAGLDYTCFHLPAESASNQSAVAPTFPADGKLTLKLTGSRPLEIMVSDSEQQPITDIAFYPWLLNKPDHPELNVSMIQEHFLETSDGNGRVTLKWFPRWQDQPVSVWPVSEKYVNKQLLHDPRSDIPLRVQLNKLVKVSGRVVLPDGKPAEGIVVRMATEVSGDHFLFPSTTDDQGMYEFLIAPNFLYMLVIDDKQWVAQSHDVFMVNPNQPILDRNIQLRSGTRVHGLLTTETTGDPIVGAKLQIYQMGSEKTSELVRANANLQRHSPPMTTFTATTDDKGRYEIMLGNGQFDIRKPIGTATHEFSIDDEPELQIDLTDVPSEAIDFRGTVVHAKSGTGLAKAALKGEAAMHRPFEWRAETDDQGRFHVKRPPLATYILVVSADGSAGAVEKIKPAQPSFDFKLQATGSVRGKLVSKSGQPLKNYKLNCSLFLPDEDPSINLNRFQRTIKTDATGNFEIKNLVPGHEYTLFDGEVGSTVLFPLITRVTVEPGARVDLGDTRVP